MLLSTGATPAPFATSVAASNVTATTARLNGGVNPNGSGADVLSAYWIDPSFVGAASCLAVEDENGARCRSMGRRVWQWTERATSMSPTRATTPSAGDTPDGVVINLTATGAPTALARAPSAPPGNAAVPLNAKDHL